MMRSLLTTSALLLLFPTVSAWSIPRRRVLTTSLTLLVPQVAHAADALAQIQTAKAQMDPIPKLIENEQWDAVRGILVTPPLSDLWTRSSKKVDLLTAYAETVDDELTVLELKEELQGHLRYLDMAVYNNVFNPIKTMGETGATKQLIQSYYEDPKNEYKASVGILQELIGMSK